MDLGTIGLNVETTGDEAAKQRLEGYLATVRRVMSELQKSVQEQKAFAEIRSSLASKEVRDNMSYWTSIQSLEKQKIQSMDNEGRARQRLLQENMRATAAMQSLGNQREAAIAAEARAAEQAVQQEERARQRLLQENMRATAAMQSLGNQREAAIAAEARAAERAAQQEEQARRRLFQENTRITAAMVSLGKQREAAYAAEARAVEMAAREAAAAEQRRYREAERIADAITSLDNQRQAAIRAQQAETQQLENQYKQLAASLDPVVRAQQRYDASMEVLNRTLREKIINEQQHKDAVQQLNMQMALAGHAVNQYGQVLGGVSRTAFRASRDGLQQLGYQVGDFAVQLQSGTPFLIAFSQQGSQLLQIFGPWGAIAGAALAITAALGTAFFATSGKAATLADSIRDLDSVMGDVRNTMDLLNDDELSFRFGNLTSEIDSLASSMLLLDQAASLRNLQQTLDRLSKENIEPGFFQRMMAGVAAGSGAGMGGISIEDYLGAFREENFEELGFAIGLETFDGMMKGITESAATGNIEAVVRGLRELYTQAVPDMETATAVVRSGGLEMLKAFSDTATTTAETAASLNGSAEDARAIAEDAEIEARERERAAAALERQQEAYRRNITSGLAIWDNLQNELDLQLAINRYGEDSIRVRELRNQQEAEAVRLRLEQLYASEGINAEEQLIIDNTMMVVEELINARNAADDTARTADRIAGNLKGAVNEAVRLRDTLAQAQSAGLSRSDQAAVLRAQIAAARGGRNIEVASAGAAAAAETAITLGRAGATADEIARVAQEAAAGAEEVALLRSELSELTRTERGGAEKISEGLREARQLFEETRTEVELYAMEVERINELHRQFPEIVTEDVVNRALKQLRDGLDETAQFARRLEEAFARTATSIVMGSESAKDAVANLLMMMAEMAIQAAFMGLFKDLFSPLGGFFAPVPSANGNVFSGGNVVPFQDGGVVNGTSYFPMGGGRTGMMGEAGPEAIMPLRRDAKGRLGVQADGEPQRIILEVRAEEGEMFVPRVRQISGNVAVQVSTATARAQSQTFGATIADFDQRGTS